MKTNYEAYTDFCNRYTVKEVENSPKLAAEFERLQYANSVNPEAIYKPNNTRKNGN